MTLVFLDKAQINKVNFCASILNVEKSFFFLACIFLCSIVFAAPEDRRIIDEKETKRLILPKGSLFALPVEDPPRPAMPESEVKFTLMGITLRGNTVFTTQSLIDLLGDAYATRVSLKDLEELSNKITYHYRDNGYLLARAYIPAQEIADGVVRISILEGVIDQVKLQNESRLADRAFSAQKYIETDKVVKMEDLERSVLLLNDLNGVEVTATLAKGERVGTSDLVLRAQPERRIDGQVEVDNNGNDFTGEARFGGSVLVNSPLGFGDALTLRVLETGQGLSYGRASWKTPILGNGLSGDIYYSQLQYSLGGELESSDSTGDSAAFGLGVSYPLLRSLNNNIYVGANVETIDLEDNISTDVTSKSNNLATVSVSGNTLGDQHVSSWSISASAGDLSVNPVAADLAGREGTYQKANFSYANLYHFGQGWSVFGSAYGQVASKNLDSSEKFGIGGANAVRAYGQGDGLGDSGYLVTGELRYGFENGIELSAFVDVGSIKINEEPWEAFDYDNTVTLSGVGLGFFWVSEYGLSLQFNVATPIDEAESSLAVTPDSEDDDVNVWVQLVKLF